MPFVSISSAFASLTYLANEEGFINLLNSCVPLGKSLNIYSAPTIAVTHDLGSVSYTHLTLPTNREV